MKTKLVLGNDTRSGLDAFLTEDVRRFHTHIIGGTGKGKSKLLELMMRHDLKHRNGFILIDPHGDLYKNMVEFSTRHRYQDRIILIDPNDTDWSVGLNYLEAKNDMIPPVLAELVMRGLSKVFEDEHQASMPSLRRWLKASLQTLIYNSATPMEAWPLLDLEDDILRNQFVQTSNDINLQREWKYFSQINKTDKTRVVDPVLNRFSVFVDNPFIRAMVSQQKSRIDFREAMDEGKAILCNISATKNITEESGRLLAVMLIDKIVNAAKSRVDISEHKRRRFYVYLDEFEDYLCDDIAKGLKGLRKFGISFILAHQEAKPIKEQNIKVYSAVMANTDIKIVFSISREDAEIMADEIFDLSADEIKDEIIQTKFRPRESRRVITTRAHTTGSTITGSDASSTTQPGLYPSPTYMNITTSTSSGYSDTDLATDSETDAPYTEYEEFKESSGRTFRSVEDKRERFITWLKTQPIQRSYFYIRGVLKKPLAIKIANVEDISVRGKDVEALKVKVYTKYALPAAEVAKQIEMREDGLLLTPSRDDEDEFEQDFYEPPQ